jgi:molybdenum cofactor cytidylyltransferase
VHRHDRAPAHWGLRAGEILDAATMARVLLAPDGYLGKAPRCAVRLLINQADGHPLEAAALAAELALQWPGVIVVGSAQRGHFAPMDNPGPRASLVLLAAGSGERMGGDKRRFVIKGRPLLEWSLSAYRDARVLEKIVVLGPGDEELGSLAIRYGFRPVICPDPSNGMSASLKSGLADVNPEADSLMLALGDMPAVRSGTIMKLLHDARKHPGAAIRPIHHEQPGHPVVLPASGFKDLAALTGDRGARDLLPSLEPLLVPCDDPGVLLDFDTAADAQAIEAALPREPASTPPAS